MKIPVHFTYYIGFQTEKPLQNPRLTGSWDENGRYSNQWSVVPMTSETGEDGCPCFRATIELDDSEIEWDFHWGVWLDTPAEPNVWGIMTEVKDRSATSRERLFKLRQADQQERYYLTQCRRLGANKFWPAGARDPGIRFALWAPNARNVEVVIGRIWDRDNPANTVTASNPIEVPKILGGYISDADEGIEPGTGPFAMRQDGEGTWVTDVNDPALSQFEPFDHRPYMFRVTKDDDTISYCTDLYSRCQIGAGSINPFGQSYEGRIVDLEGTVSCSVVVDPDRVTEFFREDILFSDRVDWNLSGNSSRLAGTLLHSRGPVLAK